MIGTQQIGTAQRRLAQHYVDTLRRANAAINKGHGNRAYWYDQIEHDWEQIRHWQHWSARDREQSRLCLDFSLAGMEVLRVRQTPTERIDWLKQALEVAQRLNDGAAERTILPELGHTYFIIGAADEARQTAQRLLDIAEGDDFSAGRAWYVLGQAGLHVGALDEASSAFQKSIALLEKAGAEAELGRALQGMGRVLMFRGDSRGAHDFFVRYMNIVERSGREAELAVAYITMNNILLELRDYPAARDYGERAVQVCQNTGFQRMLPSAWLSLGVAEAELGEFEAACYHYMEAITRFRAMQLPAALIDPLRYLADARMRQGNYAEAFVHFQEALALSREGRIPYYLCEIHAALANWYLDQNQPDAARDHIREAVSFALELGSDNFLALVLIPAIRLWIAINQVEQAAQWAGLLSKHAEHLVPRLYDPLCAQLEEAMGSEQYHQAFEQGKSLALKDVIEAMAELLDRLQPK